jgi:hypothetical protein
MSSTLHVRRVVASAFCITCPICIGNRWPASVYAWIGYLWCITVDESCGWRRHRPSAKDRIRRGRGQLDYEENRVKVAEVVREFEVVCAMADASFNDKGA